MVAQNPSWSWEIYIARSLCGRFLPNLQTAGTENASTKEAARRIAGNRAPSGIGFFARPHINPGDYTIFRWPSPPSSPKPYEEAIYDVYSDLLSQQEGPGLNRLLSPPLEPVLIQVETLSFQDSAPFEPHGAPRGLGVLPEEERFKPAVDSAIADYLKRNEQSFQLQRKFNLSKYDLITKAEEQALGKNDPSACQKYAGYERWVELSAVGFNQDQTVAVVHFIDGWRRPCSTTMVSVQGKDRMLQKRGGKWHLLANSVFSDSIS